jgi:tRNA pseudouridine synthase 10
MDVLEKAYTLLSKYPLCDHCLGRQFALLGYAMENNIRGAALKTTLTMQANTLATQAEKIADGIEQLKILATNGFSATARATLEHLKKYAAKPEESARCFLREGKFGEVNSVVERAKKELESYEYKTFLVGIELPIVVEEREDEFKAAQGIEHGESMRHEFGRVFGKALAKAIGKEAEYLKPM